MGLYERLLGSLAGPEWETLKIPVHTMMSCLGEIERGETSQATVATKFNMTAGEQTQLANLVNLILTPEESISIGGGALTLTNVGANYDTTALSKGLGICRIQLAGISQIVFAVFVNKVGSGTQSWQLWNVTDATEVGVIDDAGATGDKILSTTITPASPLSPGLKVVRIRVKSTTAADDPVYYGGGLTIRRAGKFSSAEIGEILLLGEENIAYGSVAALESRIGVI